jgi:hypothetical protein
MLHLEWHQSDLAVLSEANEAAFRAGNEVGAVAKQIYGTSESVEIKYRRGHTDSMVRETAKLMADGANFPIFEATFCHGGVLVRVDVLIPHGRRWRAIEIKATKETKDEHHMDCAIQWWVLKHAGVDVTSISLGYVNGDFIYRGRGNFDGFIVEDDLTEVADAMGPDVEALIAAATKTVNGVCPDVPVGRHCEDPHDCLFADHCWPTDTQYPIRNIGGNKERIFAWVERGYRDIRDIPAADLSAERQQMVHQVTCAGRPRVRPGAYDELKALGYPRYHLDFETTMPAVPIWEGSKPFQTHAVQFSVHIDDGTGDGSLDSTQHHEFLDLSGDPPMRPLADSLIATLGKEGPVFMWHHYEKTVINGLIQLYPDLENRLQAIVDRLVDLKKITGRYYYHPDMQGSFSIKDVAPTVNPAYDYKSLEGINEGGAAADGYLEAIHPDTSPERKTELEQQLLRYCRFDTEAMVEIARFLASIG